MCSKDQEPKSIEHPYQAFSDIYESFGKKNNYLFYEKATRPLSKSEGAEIAIAKDYAVNALHVIVKKKDGYIISFSVDPEDHLYSLTIPQLAISTSDECKAIPIPNLSVHLHHLISGNPEILKKFSAAPLVEWIASMVAQDEFSNPPINLIPTTAPIPTPPLI